MIVELFSCGRTARRIDMMKLIVDFLNFANEPKNYYIKEFKIFFCPPTSNRAAVFKHPFVKYESRLHSNFSLQYLGRSVTDIGGGGGEVGYDINYSD